MTKLDRKFAALSTGGLLLGLIPVLSFWISPTQALPILVSGSPSTPHPASATPSQPKQPNPPDLSSQRQAAAERFFDLLFSEQYAAASECITPALRDEFSPQILERKSAEFQRSNGQFVKQLKAEVADDVVLIDLQFAKRTVTFLVSFDDNLLIVGANPVLDFIGD